MKPHELVRDAYRKNSGGFGAMSSHEITIDLTRFDTEQREVKLDGDDFPYFKMALIDKALDEEHEELKELPDLPPK